MSITREIIFARIRFVPEQAQSARTLQKTHHNSTSYAQDRLEPPNVCLTEKRLNKLILSDS